MLYKEKECQENLAGHFTDETNPGFINPDLLLCTKTQNEFVAKNIVLKKGGRERERNVVSFKHPEFFSASITADSLICP